MRVAPWEGGLLVRLPGPVYFPARFASLAGGADRPALALVQPVALTPHNVAPC